MIPSNYFQRTMVVLILACMGCSLRAADVTLRFLDGKTGRPMVHMMVQLSGLKGLKGPLAGSVEDVEGPWRRITDGEGKATFHLPDPMPSQLILEPGLLKGCSKSVQRLFDPRRVLSEGIVEANEQCDKKGKLKGRFSPKPGEVILFVIPSARWDHFKDELP